MSYTPSRRIPTQNAAHNVNAKHTYKKTTRKMKTDYFGNENIQMKYFS